jgi:hypothetical protein
LERLATSEKGRLDVHRWLRFSKPVLMGRERVVFVSYRLKRLATSEKGRLDVHRWLRFSKAGG